MHADHMDMSGAVHMVYIYQNTQVQITQLPTPGKRNLFEIQALKAMRKAETFRKLQPDHSDHSGPDDK